ncbi:hypothetical protein MKW98_000008 [Papaver atlanticum]|uniref:3'-5' exonuclease domain-containing protein n=1 Tax=Papaver atlanticum TaxID=357466 RepID=A0AAD4S7D4_9MAGN|nr:hypothetical protein MKW98_000008 [Papaver atlanticum]
MANTDYHVRFNAEVIQFNGEVTIVTTLANSSESIDTVLDDFRSKRILGLDIKWNSESTNNKVATLQLCHGSRCIIIQLLHLDSIPDSLRNLLSDRSIKFFGVDIAQSIAKLEHDHGLKCWFGHELDSATAVYATYQYYGGAAGLGPSTHQTVGLSIEELESVIYHWDWSANILTNEQIKVAAIDAYASFAIGKMLFG